MIKNENEEMKRIRILYAKDFDRIYIFEQNDNIKLNYVVFLSLKGRTEERVFPSKADAIKFAKEVIQESKIKEVMYE